MLADGMLAARCNDGDFGTSPGSSRY